MSDQLRAFLDQIEALAERMASVGQDFIDESNGKAKGAEELEGNARTFGKDKVGLEMSPKRYKPGTVTDLLKECSATGQNAIDIGNALAKAAREFRAGEATNKQKLDSAGVDQA